MTPLLLLFNLGQGIFKHFATAQNLAVDQLTMQQLHIRHCIFCFYNYTLSVYLVIHLFEGLLDLQAVVCTRRAGVTGCLGERPIRPFSLLGPTLSFCALCTGAIID